MAKFKKRTGKLSSPNRPTIFGIITHFFQTYKYVLLFIGVHP